MSNFSEGRDSMAETQYGKYASRWKPNLPQVQEDIEPVWSVINEDDKVLGKMRKMWNDSWGKHKQNSLDDDETSFPPSW